VQCPNPRCGKIIPQEHNFCAYCGHDLRRQPAGPPPIPLKQPRAPLPTPPKQSIAPPRRPVKRPATPPVGEAPRPWPALVWVMVVVTFVGIWLWNSGRLGTISLGFTSSRLLGLSRIERDLEEKCPTIQLSGTENLPVSFRVSLSDDTPTKLLVVCEMWDRYDELEAWMAFRKTNPEAAARVLKGLVGRVSRFVEQGDFVLSLVFAKRYDHDPSTLWRAGPSLTIIPDGDEWVVNYYMGGGVYVSGETSVFLYPQG